jgi:hypothetical protein
MASTALLRPRRVGVLYFWHISKSGGFGKVLIPSTREFFFVHRKLIVSGEPIVGSPVEFTPAPAPEGKINALATHAVIDNSKRVRALDVPETKIHELRSSARARAVAILSGKESA